MSTSLKAAMLLLVLLKATCLGSDVQKQDGAALRRSLFFNDIYHEMSMSMSMEMGKGSKSKSKSSKSSSKSGKKSKGKKKSKSDKSSHKKDSKSGKKSKKGKGKGKGKGSSPNPLPGVPTSSPVHSMPNMPTPAPQPSGSMPKPTSPVGPTPTNPPTEDQGPGDDDTAKSVDLFSILYTIDQSRIPNLQDYRGVTDITEEYLDEFFDGVLGLSADIIYTGSTTEFTERDFVLGQPVRIEYNSTLFFSPVSPIIPKDAELQTLLESAFKGSQKSQYLETVQSLPASNLFRTTSDFEFSESTSTRSERNSGSEPEEEEEEEEATTTQGEGTTKEADESSSSNTQRAGIASAAAAGAMVLLLTGVAMYRRRTQDEDPVGKFLDNDGHVTVAGDTFTGNSSLDSQSEIHRISRPYEPTDWSEYQESEVGQQDPLQRSNSPETTLEDLQEDNSFDDSSESSSSSDGSTETVEFDTL